MPFGYHGVLLRIDLDARTTAPETPDAVFYRTFPGAALIGTHYLLKETPARLDPFDPAALLIFSSSVIAGNLASGLARFGVVGKSPLSGGAFDSRGEGSFARGLKGSGYDALIFKGALRTPGYLEIRAGIPRIVECPELWGMTTTQVTHALEQRYGADCYTAVIGPAGERRVRFAGIQTQGAHQTRRGGMGAVMGSKKLKAVVIVDPVFPEMSNPAALRELDRLLAEDGLLHNPLNRWQKEPAGMSYWYDVVDDPGYAAVRNFQGHDYPLPESFRRESYFRYYRGPSPCAGCVNDCLKTFSTGNITPDRRDGGVDFEVSGTIAINLDLQKVEAFFDINSMANDLGLDVVSLGTVLGFAAECAERGILAPEELGLDFGFGEKAERNGVELTRRIGLREGAGDLLAEGVKRAAERIGKGAEAYAMHVKGVELTFMEPRSQTNLALGYAVAPVGPQGDICEHDWDFDTEVGWPHTLERTATLGIHKRVPMGALLPEKVRNYKVLNTIWSGCDGINLCPFVSAPTRYFRLSQMAELISAVTGWDFSSYELMRIGERRNTLMRQYNLREGLSAADDVLPERFHSEPIRTGRHAGKFLDRARFQEMVRLYYAMMGWDEQGRPLPATLVDLSLNP